MMVQLSTPAQAGDLVIEPGPDDPRFLKFQALLQEHGVVDGEGHVIVPTVKIRRGVFGDQHVWRAEWDEA